VGFFATPGGYRNMEGISGYLGIHAIFWVSESSSSDHAWYQQLYSDDANINTSAYGKTMGLSVRCIQD